MSKILQEVKLVVIVVITTAIFLAGLLQVAEAGGGGAGGGSSSNSQSSDSFTTSRSAAESSAQGYNDLSAALGRDYSYGVRSTYNSSEGWGYTVGRIEDREGRESDIGGGGSRSQATTCDNKNLTTIDVFFVPAGAQPVTVPARTINTGGTRPDERQTRVISAYETYNPVMVPRNELAVGVLYEPIAQIRNSANCGSELGGRAGDRDTFRSYGERVQELSIMTPVYAGGDSDSSNRANDYINNVRTQLPFGSNGSFPVRARIDLGNNRTYEWVEYINAVGPIRNGQTVFVRFPAFSTTEVGNHMIQIVTDIRHSIDAGRGCYASTTPDSAGWGCIREMNERDNDRSESFSTVASSTSYRVTVDVNDITVGIGDSIDTIPFSVTNTGNATIASYRYRVTITDVIYASTSRTTSLSPGAGEVVRSTGSFTVPDRPTTLPLRVCAQLATGSESCDDARIVVVIPQCSDSRDNDSDGFIDSNDPGCYTDPSDPSTYDPAGDNESDSGVLASPTITLTARPDVVRYDDRATLTYTVAAAYPVVCTLTGGRDTQSVTHVPPNTSGAFTTQPLQSTVTFTLTCRPNIAGVIATPTAVTETVQVIPLAQET